MSTSDAAVVQLIAEIQAETLELDNLRKRGASAAELESREHELECLHWRLAATARGAARADLGDAA
jgi:hypothetical protein